MKLICALLAAVTTLTVSSVFAADYSLDNGYISFTGQGGVIRNLRVDPSGTGTYGPVLAREIYAGEQPADPANLSLPYHQAGTTITLDNVRIYSNPRDVGLNQWDTPTRLAKGTTLGQLFYVDKNGLSAVSIRVPTWSSTVSAMTLKVFKDGPGGELIAEKRCKNIGDNSWQTISFPAQDKGSYYVEMAEPKGPVGWWTLMKGRKVGTMHKDGAPLDFGSRSFRAKVYDVFPGGVRISLVGSKLFAEATPDKPERRFKWRMVTPFIRDGYELSNPEQIPFSRFYSDRGQYVPIAQLKRRNDLDYGMAADEWIHATGSANVDLRIALENGTLDWEMAADSMTLVLGQKVGITALPHTAAAPDYYPRFYSSDAALDKSLNSLFYDRAYSWPLGGVNADWFEWMALIHFWNRRPGSLEYWRSFLLTYQIDQTGYVHTWGKAKGWPFPDNEKYDTRHFTTNPNFILACYRYYAWTGDTDFLKENAERIRSAMGFMLTELQGSEGILVLPDKDHGGTPDDVPSNYWDDIPFGGQSAYVNAYFHPSLDAMAQIEQVLGDADAAKQYAELKSLCRKRYNELFWNDQAGRYIGCIDENGVLRDYGFTYVNLEAAAYDLPDKPQVERIYHWMEAGKTSSGKTDTYARFRFAPRVNTIDCKEWWYLNGKAEIPAQDFDTHLENGGAILYTSGYDIMARAKYLGADNAFRRLKEILERYEEPDRLCGGAPLRYREVNGWQIGTDIPFPESGLVGASFLYAFLGIRANSDGLMIKPNLPAELEFAGVRNLHYHGLALDIKVTPSSVTINCSEPGNRFTIKQDITPGEGFLFNVPQPE